MFYRIHNYIFNLNEVTNIHSDKDGNIIVDTKNNSRYIIYFGTVDVNAIMDKIQKDLAVNKIA